MIFKHFLARSPIFTHLNTTLQGLVTIRAFGTQEILKNEFDQHQNLHSSACWMFIASSSAFGFLLDVFCFFYTALVIYSFLWLGEGKYRHKKKTVKITYSDYTAYVDDVQNPQPIKIVSVNFCFKQEHLRIYFYFRIEKLKT